MNENVSKEYKRLKGLFKDVDESKTSLIDELLKKCFLKVGIDDLNTTLENMVLFKGLMEIAISY